MGKILTLEFNLTPQNNRDLNQGLLHILSKFGDPSSNGCWVIARTSKCLPHTQTDGRTDGHTDRQTQATTIPDGQNWPRVKMKVLLSKGRIIGCEYKQFQAKDIMWLYRLISCTQLMQFKTIYHFDWHHFVKLTAHANALISQAGFVVCARFVHIYI